MLQSFDESVLDRVRAVYGNECRKIAAFDDFSSEVRERFGVFLVAYGGGGDIGGIGDSEDVVAEIGAGLAEEIGASGFAVRSGEEDKEFVSRLGLAIEIDEMRVVELGNRGIGFAGLDGVGGGSGFTLPEGEEGDGD